MAGNQDPLGAGSGAGAMQNASPQALFGGTPVARPSTAGQTAGFATGVATPVLSDSTFTGGIGSTAYTIGDIVRHLKTINAIAP